MRGLASRRAVLAAGLAGGWPGARAGAGRPLVVSVPALPLGSGAHRLYFPALLRLALEATAATDGPFEWRTYDAEMTSLRQVAEVRRHGAINVLWDGSDRHRESELRAVPVSLLHQLNDYRVFIIHREDQARYSAVRTLDDLRRLKAGAGVNWPSTAVLEANGLPVVEAVRPETLFPMLRGRRFDYLPRGAWEAWAEMQEHGGEGLAIEQTLFLHYPVPFHFFVHRDDVALADRIERGLARAHADGRFDRLMERVPSFRRGLAEIRAGRRRILELQIP